MNLLILSHRIPYPANKGEKIRTFNQIRYLVQKGHNIVVFAPYESDFERTYADELQELLGISVAMFPLKSAWLRKFQGFLRHEPLSLSHFHSARMQQSLEQHLQTEPVDAILCTSSAMAGYVFNSDYIASQRGTGRVRLLIDFMDLDSDKWRQYQSQSVPPMSWVYGREERLLRRIEQRCYQVFERCFFISENEVALFSKHLSENDKLQVLGNGIDTTLFHPSAREEKTESPVFLFTGVMNYRPNEDAVLWFVSEVWDEIRARWPGAEFVIAGMDPSPAVRQLARHEGITVTGYVDDILPYYHRATVFVAPFRMARGVQNKILQALACGLPVVTTSQGLEGINASRGEDVLIAETGSDFLGAIERLLCDSEYYHQLANAGPALIRRYYSWASVLENLNSTLEPNLSELTEDVL